LTPISSTLYPPFPLQYNTCFWYLVQRGGKTKQEAQKTLAGTLSDFKNELLFREFGVNYNDLPLMYKKGSILIRCVAGGEALGPCPIPFRYARSSLPSHLPYPSNIY
jgi:hypothetical protein